MALRGATAGALGSVVALLVTFPLATAKVRLQAQQRKLATSSTSTYDVIHDIIHLEGFTKLYAGLLPALGKSAGTNFVFYYFFDLLKGVFVSQKQKSSSLLRSLMHGMTAGACVQMVMLPFDLCVTRLMATGSSASFVSTLVGVVRESGFFSLWDGLRPGLCLTVNPGVTTLMRDRLNNYFVTPSTPLRNFIIGMASKATASTLTYPYTLIKVQMQVEGMRHRNKTGDEGVETKKRTKKRTMKSIFEDIVKSSGYFGLWSGLSPQLTNAVLKEALLNMVRLEILKFVNYTFDAVLS